MIMFLSGFLMGLLASFVIAGVLIIYIYDIRGVRVEIKDRDVE